MCFRYLSVLCLLFCATGLGIGSFKASASTYFYSMSATLSDGGSASGNFSVDWGTTSGSLNISTLTIIAPFVSGTVSNLQSQTPFGLCLGTSCAPFHVNSNLGSFSLGINLAFSPPNPSGATSLLLIPSFSRIVATQLSPFVQSTGDFTSASVISVTETPVPPALPLFVTGLGALGLLSRLRKRKIEKSAATVQGLPK